MKKTTLENIATVLILLGAATFGIWGIIQLSQSPRASLSGITRAGPADIYPNSIFTPGATNPAITQTTINQTICNPTWSTKSIRPTVSYTNNLKAKQIKQYGYQDTKAQDYEEDHLISLELGGNPTDPQNIWPEPYTTTIAAGGAKVKDTVENYLKKQVCSNSLSLKEAQREISTDWYGIYLKETRSSSPEALSGITSGIDNDDQ